MNETEFVALFPDGSICNETKKVLKECTQDPTNLVLCENAMQLCISNKEFTNAQTIWKSVAKPSNKKIAEFRLLEIDLMQNGFIVTKFEKMKELASQSPCYESEWDTLIRLDKHLNGGLSKKDIVKEAARFFPGNSKYLSKRYTPLSLLKKTAKALRVHKLLRLAFSIPTIRAMFLHYERENWSKSSSSIEDALSFAYNSGSIFAQFPVAPEHQKPENFDTYINTRPDPWWPWIKENTPDKDAQGKKLLDIGAGTGFNGQHFQYLGYEITAHSGNVAELAECARRGMKTVQSEMHNIPVENDSFDAAFACHTLEHSIIPYGLLLEIKRILKPGGLLFVNLPYPIEGDPAIDFPECYDAKSDKYTFETDPITGHFKHLEQAYYCYSFDHHIFVLTYWQWRWLFKNLGFEHLASTIEVIGTGEFLPGETIARKPEYSRLPKNQHFILKNN